SQPLVTKPASDVWHIRMHIAEMSDRDTFVLAPLHAGQVRLGPHDTHRVAPRGERAGQVEGTPAASPAVRREGVGDDQHAHRCTGFLYDPRSDEQVRPRRAKARMSEDGADRRRRSQRLEEAARPLEAEPVRRVKWLTAV